MKRICEIYDISKNYEMPTGTVLSTVRVVCPQMPIDFYASSVSVKFGSR